MTTVWVAFVLAFAVAALVTRLVIRVAWRFGVLDRPDGYRKVHDRPVPRLGGVAVYIAFAVPLVLLTVFPEISAVSGWISWRATRLAGFFVGATLALVLGVTDDVLSLRPIWKLLWQLLIATLAYSMGFSIKAISNPFGPQLDLGLLSYPVTVFWFVGCMNAVNLLDGLDGLAAGMALFVGLTLFLVSLHFRNVMGMFLMACLSGATLGFLMHNFPPAKIFLGDSGSMLLGFMIAALSLVGASRKAEAAVALFVPIVALGLPILDTLLAIVRRWYKRLPISAPDRHHIHHALISMGYSQRRVVLTLYSICVVLGLAALVITFGRNEIVLLVIGSLVVTGFVCVRIFSGVRMTDVLVKLSEDKVRTERATRARMAVDRAVSEIPAVGSLDALWGACVRAFEGLDLDHAQLALYGAAASGTTARTWHSPLHEDVAAAEQGVDGWSCRLGLRAGDDHVGEIVLGQAFGRYLAAAEMPDLMERLRDAITEGVRRFAQPSAPAA